MVPTEPVNSDELIEMEVGLSTKFGGSVVEAGPAVATLLSAPKVVGTASMEDDSSSSVEVGTGETVSVAALEEDSVAEDSALAELEAVSVAEAPLV